jgi:hypothetical protein
VDTGWACGKQEKNADNSLVHIGFKGIRRYGREGKITICLKAFDVHGTVHR